MDLDIAVWLRGLDLEQYQQAFRENAIDSEILSELTDADLEKLGVLLGHRKRMLRAIAANAKLPSMASTSPENVAVFGRHQSDRGQAAFPQLQSVYLAECGTHAIVDAGFWPCHTCERLGGFRVLRSVTNEMLVM